MDFKRIIKIVLSGIVFSVILVALSYLINDVWLGEAHVKYGFLRPDNDFRVNPGLMINTLIWGMLVGIGFIYFGKRINIQNRFLKGMIYGLLIYIFFIMSQEFYYYLFISFDLIIIAGSLIHYILTFVIGGGIISVILTEKTK